MKSLPDRYEKAMLVYVVLYFIFIPYLIEGKNSPLYHSQDALPENATYIKRLHILGVSTSSSCNITACHWSTPDNKLHHLNCHQDECEYRSYHCLHDERSIVHFCGNFDKCDEHTRHIAQINDPPLDGIDIYSVPCPKGYIQPNTQHSCFELCIPDKSSGQETTEHEPPDPHSENESISHHDPQTVPIDEQSPDKTESPNKDKTGTPMYDVGLQENGLNIDKIINVSIGIIATIALIIISLAVILLWKKKLVTRANYTKKETNNNTLLVNNPHSVTINIGDGKQSVPLLEGSEVDNKVNATAQNEDHTIEDLKNMQPEVTMGPIELGPSTEYQSLHASQTQLKHPPSP